MADGEDYVRIGGLWEEDPLDWLEIAKSERLRKAEI